MTIIAVMRSPSSHICSTPPKIVVLEARPTAESPMRAVVWAMMKAIAAVMVSARAQSADAAGRAARVWRQRRQRAFPPGGSSGRRCRRSHSGQATVSITRSLVRGVRGSYSICATASRAQSLIFLSLEQSDLGPTEGGSGDMSRDCHGGREGLVNPRRSASNRAVPNRHRGARARPRLLRIVRARPRLFSSIVLGLLVSLGLVVVPGLRPVTRFLVGW